MAKIYLGGYQGFVSTTLTPADHSQNEQILAPATISSIEGSSIAVLWITNRFIATNGTGYAPQSTIILKQDSQSQNYGNISNNIVYRSSSTTTTTTSTSVLKIAYNPTVITIYAYDPNNGQSYMPLSKNSTTGLVVINTYFFK